jgi:hypothetical protein
LCLTPRPPLHPRVVPWKSLVTGGLSVLLQERKPTIKAASVRTAIFREEVKRTIINITVSSLLFEYFSLKKNVKYHPENYGNKSVSMTVVIMLFPANEFNKTRETSTAYENKHKMDERCYCRTILFLSLF